MGCSEVSSEYSQCIYGPSVSVFFTSLTIATVRYVHFILLGGP
jgi:hypothetical protein